MSSRCWWVGPYFNVHSIWNVCQSMLSLRHGITGQSVKEKRNLTKLALEAMRIPSFPSLKTNHSIFSDIKYTRERWSYKKHERMCSLMSAFCILQITDLISLFTIMIICRLNVLRSKERDCNKVAMVAEWNLILLWARLKFQLNNHLASDKEQRMHSRDK